ncbi:hypothetical protein NLM33_04360 [Bradyrhizobium sp. CCGUVB1N3]|uniref:hypothetical protein n=1 Tax=Bradyrhizobium sp. CCGUVB1N3 TaxID=2949629 RepID=UPI0020B36BD4|nr:hypothetical protein [Bradyrhizobium sp. CCGUVB1N3]MCP3469562.1 hypothetical protein [Bradyrhizobium sp. CCGUVB1N3]
MSDVRKPGGIFIVFVLVVAIGVSLVTSPPARAQQGSAILFQSVRIFDGRNSALSAPSNVLIRNGKIYKNALTGDKTK